MKKEKPNAKKLYINPSKETNLSFHLSVVLRPDLYSWFYENFINVVIFGDSTYFIEFLDNIIDESYRELMEQRIIRNYNSFAQKEDVIKYLTESIENDFYSYIWVDKYYVPNNESYMNWHYVHAVMVYGYDDVNETISVINFSFEKGVVLQEISYDDFVQAFISGEEYYKNGGGNTALEETITSFKIKTNHNSAFELDRFMLELRDYLRSTVNKAKLRRVYLSANNMAYGISIYDKMIALSEQFSRGISESVISFKSLSDMCIHKDYIYERLVYIKNNYTITSECEEKIEEFRKVSDLWHRAKSLNIKYNVKDGKAATIFSRNLQFNSKFAEILREAKTIEKNILGYVYNSLKKYALPKSKKQPINKNDFNIEYLEDDSKIKILLNEPTLIDSIEIIDNNTALNNDGIKKILFSDGTDTIAEGQQYNILHKNQMNFRPKKVDWFEYSETESEYLHRDMGKLDFYIYKPTDKVYLDFSMSRYQSCERQADMDSSELNLNALQNLTSKPNNSFRLIGKDPVICYDINFDADKLKYVYLKYNTSCLSENAQLFFATYDNPFLFEDQSKIFTISPNDKPFEYILDMSDNVKWNGVAKEVRFDPVSYDNISEEGECFVEYIEISDRLPEYGSEKDYMKTQGVNGWSYYTYNNGITYREMIWNEQKKV